MSSQPESNGLIMRVHEPTGPLVAETQTPQTPDVGLVRVDIKATGVCFADVGVAAAQGDSVAFPVTPGHEIAGVIAEVGADVTHWHVGDRVAVGWFGGSCGYCSYCGSGDPVHCPQRVMPGWSYPGGWAQSIIVPAEALAAIPDGMDFFDAAPMGCAGVTTFNATRNANVPTGGTVAVFGIGGLGHLAVQFASAMGYRTIAIARGTDRAEMARQLGADHYIDSTAQDPGQALAELGGADLILSTASTTDPVETLLPGLAVYGRLVMIGVDDGSITVPAGQLMSKGQTVTGHLTGSPTDTEQTMRFAHRNGVRPIIEQMPLTEANAAVARVSNGDARFRIVLDPGGSK